jgi:hypothetical protein
MDIYTILKDLGAFTIASGLITWLIKIIVTKSLDRDIEKFKNDLKIEQIKQSSLYDERAEIISNLYELLDEYYSAMQSMSSPVELSGDIPKSQKIGIAIKKGWEFVNFYSKKKIYFTPELILLLDKLNDQLYSAWVDFTIYPPAEVDEWEPKDVKKERWEFWKKSWKIVSKEVPKIKEELEIEFRKILGVTDSKISSK